MTPRCLDQPEVKLHKSKLMKPVSDTQCLASALREVI